MLSQADNERLVRVGPGTEMGAVMRRYWHPVAASRELPGADCAPVRLQLLGERFVLFRDSEGKVGMLDELCMHRGASLAIGRVEEGGIRCLYHGWKFAVDGTILETPNHADCRFKDRLKAPAYPVVEKNGVIWAYIGPKELEPPFRTFASDDVPDENRMIFRVQTNVNYLQLWEGGLDSSHVSTLHTNQSRPTWGQERGVKLDVKDWAPMDDPAPAFAVEDTPFGYHYSATRRVPPSRGSGEGMRNVRITPAIMPHGRIIGGPNINFLVWETPHDDEWTSTFFIVYGPVPVDRDWVLNLLGLNDPRYWSEEDQVFKGTWDNGFYQDRAAMTRNFTGLRGIEVEDAVIGMSYGPIYDRSKEHLVTADLAVVRVRQRLFQSLELVKAGQPPIGVDVADLREVAAPDVDVPEGTDWRDLAPAHRFLEAAE